MSNSSKFRMALMMIVLWGSCVNAQQAEPLGERDRGESTGQLFGGGLLATGGASTLEGSAGGGMVRPSRGTT